MKHHPDFFKVPNFNFKVLHFSLFFSAQPEPVDLGLIYDFFTADEDSISRFQVASVAQVPHCIILTCCKMNISSLSSMPLGM